MTKRASGLLLSLVVTLSTAASAEETSTSPMTSESSVTELDTLRVLGGQRSDLTQPTSPRTLPPRKLEELQTTDLHKVLQHIPGAYVRQEEGEGLRPNVGLRGTNPDRSKKVVWLEDHVLVGPAPYSAPAAYYTPSLLHTESLDVMQGFAAIHHGPNSIGGALHSRSYAVPTNSDADSFVEVAGGSFATGKLKSVLRGTTSWGGYAISLGRQQSAGFKKLDGGGNVGFEQNDLVAKFKWQIRAEHGLQLKLGLANEDSRETYLGLTEEDFFAQPDRRYAASALDQMRWQRHAIQLTHEWLLPHSSVISTDAYSHQLDRTWYRLDRFRDSSVNLRAILAQPTGTNQLFYDVLRGQSDSSGLGANGDLFVANNERHFLSQGVQTRWIGESAEHSWQATLRWHRDSIDRDHRFDVAQMSGGRLQALANSRSIDKQNREAASAWLASLQDDWRIQDWVLTGVMRYETAEFAYTDALNSSLNKSRRDSVWVPGLGALYQLSEDTSLRASVNRAVTLAGLDAQGRERREESLNTELALKHFSGDDSWQADLVYFRNDYQNLTGTCTSSTGCASSQLDQQFNGGRALVHGIEARMANGWSAWGIWFPITLNLTSLEARFAEDFVSDSAEWGIGQIRAGDPLPYVPQFRAQLNVGAQRGAWNHDLDISYQGETADQSAAQNRINIAAFGLVGWSTRYKFNDSWAMQFRGDNLLGKDHVVAARPFGFRPGKPRSLSLSLTAAF